MEPTTDHKMIQQWAKSRQARPAFVEGTNNGVPAVLRFIVPGANWNNRNLCEVTWEDFFIKFDLLELAFVFQETAANGELSMHNEFLQRSTTPPLPQNWN